LTAAWQIEAGRRPLLGKSQLASRPAIRFDGARQEFLATTLIRTKNDATVVVVCEFGKRNAPGFGQVLMLSGAAKLAIRQEWNNVAAAQVRWRKSDEHTHLKMSAPASDETPFVIACRYSFVKNSFQLFANGELIAEDHANGPIAREASHFIGCRNRTKNFFTGSISEIAVYDSLLDREGLDTAMSVLMQKYAIDSSAR
jgi:hypothetical protein